MRIMRLALLCLIVFVAAGSAYGQSWNSGIDTGALNVEWTFDMDTYTFNVTSPIVDDRPYQIVAWTLQPFSIPEPVEVVCPDGWEWRDKGGWNYFELAKNNEKYNVGGSALEPGETLTFVYKIGSSMAPVNPGGPVESAPAFLAHVGAVDGVSNHKYVPYATQISQTWHEVVDVRTIVDNPVPEPSGLLAISSAFFALGCFKIKRARV